MPQGRKVGDPPAGYMGGYHRPTLVRDGDRWRLWFDYHIPGTFVSMGYAETTGDLLDASGWRVVRADDAPLIRDWPNACVVRAGELEYRYKTIRMMRHRLASDGSLAP